jgi:uncharacterized membrane protein
MKSFSRSTALKIAAVISFLLAAGDLFGSIQTVLQGPAAAGPTNGSPPYPIVVLGIATTAVGIVAAYGTWKEQRWGIVLTIILNVLRILTALPAFFFAPSIPVILIFVGIVPSIIVVVLCLWRDRKLVTA